MLFKEVGCQGVDACLVRWDIVDAYGVWNCLLERASEEEREGRHTAFCCKAASNGFAAKGMSL